MGIILNIIEQTCYSAFILFNKTPITIIYHFSHPYL